MKQEIPSEIIYVGIMQSFSNIISNPPYNAYLHFKFFHLSLEKSSNVMFLHPARYLLDEKGANKHYNDLLQKIDGHVHKVVIDKPEKMFPQGCSLSGANICYIYVEKSKCFDEIIVEHRNIKKSVVVKSLYDIDEHANNPTYLSFKKKVLDYCKKSNLKQNFSRTNNGKYGIQIGDLASYEFFGKRNKKGILRKVEENVDNGVHTDDKELAESMFTYLRNPISVLALHIYKKDFHVWVSLDSVPWFKTVDEFLNPQIPLNLNNDEIEYAKSMQETHPTWR